MFNAIGDQHYNCGNNTCDNSGCMVISFFVKDLKNYENKKQHHSEESRIHFEGTLNVSVDE